MSARLCTILVATLLVLAAPVTVMAQGTTELPAPSRGLDLGMTTGLLFSTNMPLRHAMGVAVAVSLGGLASLQLGFTHAGAGLFGVGALGVSFFDLAILLAASRQEPFGTYMFGGATYAMVSGFAGTTGTVMLLAGLGIHLSPLDFMDIRLGYAARAKYGIMHVLEASVSVRF